jgi:hypothetical protein
LSHFILFLFYFIYFVCFLFIIFIFFKELNEWLISSFTTLFLLSFEVPWIYKGLSYWTGGVAAFHNMYKARSNNHPVWHRIVDALMFLGVDMFREDVNQAAQSGTGYPNVCPTRTASTASLNALKAGATASHNSFSRTCSMSGVPSPSASSNPVSVGHLQPIANPNFHLGPPPGMVLMQPPPPNAQGPNMALMHPGMVAVPQQGMVSIPQPGMVPLTQPGLIPQQPGLVQVPPGMVPVPQPGKMQLPQPGMIPVQQPVPQPGMPVQMMHFPGKSGPPTTDGPLSGQSGPPSISGPVGNMQMHPLM